MGNELRTDEPEVGQVAFIHDSFDDPRVVICSQIQGVKVWSDGFDSFRINQNWLPITTPEERRLRKEVEDLRHAADCDLEHIEAYHLVQAENDKLRAEVERLREFLQEVFPYIPQNIELARQVRAEFGTAGGGEQ